MTTATYPSTLTFEKTDLRVIDRNGRPWLAGPDLARALGYARSDKVSKLYRRHHDEFTSDMTGTVKLTVSGGTYPDNPNMGASKNLKTTTRIYSPRGCHLIAMLARTDNAKAFRRWVLDVLENMQPIKELEALPLKPLTLLGLIHARDHDLRMAINRIAAPFFERTVQDHPGHTSAELSVIMGCRRIDAARLVMHARGDKQITAGEARHCLITARNAITWMPADQRRALKAEAKAKKAAPEGKP